MRAKLGGAAARVATAHKLVWIVSTVISTRLPNRPELHAQAEQRHLARSNHSAPRPKYSASHLLPLNRLPDVNGALESTQASCVTSVAQPSTRMGLGNGWSAVAGFGRPGGRQRGVHRPAGSWSDRRGDGGQILPGSWPDPSGKLAGTFRDGSRASGGPKRCQPTPANPARARSLARGERPRRWLWSTARTAASRGRLTPLRHSFLHKFVFSEPRGPDRPAGPSVAPTASRRDVPVVTAKTSRPWPALPPMAASPDELFGPFSETAVGFVLIRFYPWLEQTSARSAEPRSRSKAPGPLCAPGSVRLGEKGWFKLGVKYPGSATPDRASSPAPHPPP